MFAPTPNVLRYLKSVGAIRQRRFVGTDAQITSAIERQGAQATPAIVRFENRYGGWVGSWLALGVLAHEARYERTAQHVLVGRMGPHTLFMDEAGSVYLKSGSRLTWVGDDIDSWLEFESHAHPHRIRHGYIRLRCTGADWEDLAPKLKATALPEEASSPTWSAWTLPKKRGVVRSSSGGFVGHFPTSGAAARCLPDPNAAVALSVPSIVPKRSLTLDAPSLSEVEALSTFQPLDEHGARLFVAHAQANAFFRQWRVDAAQKVRACLTLGETGGGHEFFLGVPCNQRSWGFPASAEVCLDPHLSVRSRADFDALLFGNGFYANDALFSVEGKWGGVSFSNEGPVLLGVSALLTYHAGISPADTGGGVPIALAYGAVWARMKDGSVRALEEPRGPKGPYANTDTFFATLAKTAGAFRGYAYPVLEV